MYNYKQVIVMRTDLNMRKGKMIAQGAHASMKALLGFSSTNESGSYILIPISSYNEKTIAICKWLSGNYAKICVGIGNEKDLLELFDQAKNADLLCALITDSGLTEFHGVPTNTCIAIGPAKSEEIDQITGHLKLL